jgi:hypothetical protein
LRGARLRDHGGCAGSTPSRRLRPGALPCAPQPCSGTR